ncbi:hypothetical protein E2C01_084968 [Portunus trituberculatus]|uniref:Uncharacterized protein n=1 Tax=Portunus trituberculatus TaxID=210409 RepID=A0A5B7J1C7_PORTR|nr:hypothetical protein [Portunus trituberculatus]
MVKMHSDAERVNMSHSKQLLYTPILYYIN